MFEMIAKFLPCSLRVRDRQTLSRARTPNAGFSFDQFGGPWLAFPSHSAEFSPVCTSEFLPLARAADQFAARDRALPGLSVDGLYACIGWVRAISDTFGEAIPIPIVENTSVAVARAWAMPDETAQESEAVRAAYFMAPAGFIRAVNLHPTNVGRWEEEIRRLCAADLFVPPKYRAMTAFFQSKINAGATEKLKTFAQAGQLMILSFLLTCKFTITKIGTATGIGQLALSHQVAASPRTKIINTYRDGKQHFYRMLHGNITACIRHMAALFGDAFPVAQPISAGAASFAKIP